MARIIVNGDHHGDIGTVITGSTGPLALNGDVYEGDTDPQDSDGGRIVSGNGMTVIEGDYHGTISHRF
ncbi:hypothetical protein ACFYXC_31440 [Streptomyces sp. NPDC002701]|uniref:hypothetical protein n=1 Tax=Streptomyces sp. NPDC002701 TaxID=3364661 RepID=UPI0036AFEF98